MADSTTFQLAEAVHRAFADFLRRQNIRYTAARRKVLDAVLNLREHFEAEEVLYLLRQRGMRIGKATVYRTLPLLVAAGVLRRIQFDQRHAYYELAFGERPHDHMVCRRCGRIIEFAAEGVIALRNRLAARHAFHATGHRFQITGLCGECAPGDRSPAQRKPEQRE